MLWWEKNNVESNSRRCQMLLISSSFKGGWSLAPSHTVKCVKKKWLKDIKLSVLASSLYKMSWFSSVRVNGENFQQIAASKSTELWLKMTKLKALGWVDTQMLISFQPCGCKKILKLKAETEKRDNLSYLMSETGRCR